MAHPSTSQSCGVCGEAADSIHFGGLSCRCAFPFLSFLSFFRACAAFFRRKVAGNRKTVRRCVGQCKLTNQVLRRLCASCRFEKCVQIGMKMSAVLSRLPIKSENSPVSLIPPRSFLEQLNEVYKNLVDARKIAHRLQVSVSPGLSL